MVSSEHPCYAKILLFSFTAGDGISRESSPFINNTEMDRGNMYEGKNMALFEVSFFFCLFFYKILQKKTYVTFNSGCGSKRKQGKSFPFFFFFLEFSIVGENLWEI